jgi:hypothetical protein
MWETILAPALSNGEKVARDVTMLHVTQMGLAE